MKFTLLSSTRLARVVVSWGCLVVVLGSSGVHLRGLSTDR